MKKYYGYPPKCDICGRFHGMGKGSAWLDIPASDIPGESGKEASRCSDCVKINGGFDVDRKYKKEIVTGFYS